MVCLVFYAGTNHIECSQSANACLYVIQEAETHAGFIIAGARDSDIQQLYSV